MTNKKNAGSPAAEVEQPSAAETAAGNEVGQSSAAGASDPETKDSPRTVDAEGDPVKALCKKMTLVLCAAADSIDVLTKTWERKAPQTTIIKQRIDGKTFPEIIDTMLADDDVPDSFVYVPAYCFPTHPVSLADLLAYRIRKRGQIGKPYIMESVNDTGLPVFLQAKFILQAQEKLGETYTEEEFFTAYNAVAHAGELPEEIGMTFGNAVAYVVKQPSCMLRVAEVLVRKKFICANYEGFSYIKGELKLLYGKE